MFIFTRMGWLVLVAILAVLSVLMGFLFGNGFAWWKLPIAVVYCVVGIVVFVFYLFKEGMDEEARSS